MIKVIIIIGIAYALIQMQIKSKATGSTSNTTNKLNPFEILGISSVSSIEEIKEAYHFQIKKNHPDQLSHMSMDIQKFAEEKIKIINAAFEEIKDIKKYS